MRRTTATSLATVSSWCCSSGDDPGATDTCAAEGKVPVAEELRPASVYDLKF